MSFLLYLTTRAPGSAAPAVEAPAKRKTKRIRDGKIRCPRRFISVICHSSFEVQYLRIPVIEPARDRLREKHECCQYISGGYCHKPRANAELPRNFRETRNHGCAPARTSSPFSKP